MFVPIVLYAAAGALLLGGAAGGRYLVELSNDERAVRRMQRQWRHEAELVREALALKDVRDEAERRGLDLDDLYARLETSRAAQRTVADVLTDVLGATGTPVEDLQALLAQ